MNTTTTYIENSPGVADALPLINRFVTHLQSRRETYFTFTIDCKG